MKSDRIISRYYLMILLIWLCGLILRVSYLNYPFQGDEAKLIPVMCRVSGGNISSVINTRHPYFLYYIVNGIVIAVSGSITEPVMRLPCVILGSLVPVMVFLFFHLWGEKKKALWGALFVAFNPFHIAFSRAIGYWEDFFVFSVLLAFSLYIIRKHARWLYVSFILALGGVLGNPLFLLQMFPLFIAGIYRKMIRLNLRSIIAASAFLAVSVFPYILFFTAGASRSYLTGKYFVNQNLTDIYYKASKGVQILIESLAMWVNYHGAVFSAFMLAVFATGAVWLVISVFRKRMRNGWLVFGFCWFIFMVLTISFGLGTYGSKTIHFSFPAIIIIVACVLGAIRKKSIEALLAVFMIGAQTIMTLQYVYDVRGMRDNYGTTLFNITAQNEWGLRENDGIKSAGYYIRKNTSPEDRFVAADIDGFRSRFYLNRWYTDTAKHGGLSHVIEHIDEFPKVRYIILKEEDILGYTRLYQDVLKRFSLNAVVVRRERMLLRIFGRGIHDSSAEIMDSGVYDRLYDKTYGKRSEVSRCL